MDDNNELLNKPLFSLTVKEFLEVMDTKIGEMNEAAAKEEKAKNPGVTDPKYAYGMDGLADLFGCSRKTAWKIKNSGEIEGAIKQIGRTIVTDKEYALKLAGGRQNPRKNAKIKRIIND